VLVKKIDKKNKRPSYPTLSLYTFHKKKTVSPYLPSKQGNPKSKTFFLFLFSLSLLAFVLFYWHSILFLHLSGFLLIFNFD
jgi:hypothetical protein